MKNQRYVIYYNRKNANGNTYKHYLIKPGTYCLDVKFAHKFEDKLNAEKFIENELIDHFHISEPFIDMAIFSGHGSGTF